MVNAIQTMKNSDFLAEVYGTFAPGHYGWVTSFRADPNNCAPEVWGGRLYKGTTQQAAMIDRSGRDNTYYCTAILKPTDDGEQIRRKETFSRLAVLVLDDVPLGEVTHMSYSLQTSPGKWQVGIFLDQDDPDCADRDLVDRIMQALSVRGRVNDSSGNGCVRYVRLPEGMNTKPRAAGDWAVRVESWNPSVRWTLDDACAAFGLDLDKIRSTQSSKPAPKLGTNSHQGNHAGEILATLMAPVSERTYHDGIVRLSASLIAGGMFPGAAVDFLYSLMDQVKPSGPFEEVKRWEARRNEIPRAVKSAEKFAPPERQKSVSVSLTLPKALNEDGTVNEDATELLLDLKALQARTGKISWQVKHMIPDDSLGMVFGASGTFKSFIALDHALHVAHGLPWMGMKTKQGPVVYVAAEGGAGIARRVQAWHLEHGLEMPSNFYVCITPLVLSEPEHVEVLATEIGKLPQRPSLIYIDTLSQTFDGDENSSNDIANYLRLINARIRAPLHATVIVIHHSGHAATERPRGSSALMANVDFMLGVYRPEADRMQARVDVVKQKDGDRLSGQSFELAKHQIDVDEDGEEISSLVAVWAKRATTLIENHKAKTNLHEATVLKLIEQAGGAIQESELRHGFYNYLAHAAKLSGKPYNQQSARPTYHRTLKGLSDRGVANMDAAGFVRKNG